MTRTFSQTESEGPDGTGNDHKSAGNIGLKVGIGETPRLFVGDSEIEASGPRDQQQSMLAVQSLSRAARDHFISASKAASQGRLEDAEAQLFSCCDHLERIWPHAVVRDRPFHDLLGLLDAAVRNREIAEFDERKLTALQIIFRGLCKPFVDPADVERAIVSCVEHEIDLAAPTKSQGDAPFRIIIEPITKP